MSVRRSKQRRLQKIQETEDRTNPTLQKEKKRKARILADLKKRQARQAAAEKKAAKAKAKQKRVTREEGPGQGTKPSTRELTERRAKRARGNRKLTDAQRQAETIAKAKKVYKTDEAYNAAAKRANWNAAELASFAVTGPAAKLGISLVKGGYKLGNRIFKSFKAAQNAAKNRKKGMKTVNLDPKQISTSRTTQKQIAGPPKRITDQRPPSVRDKPPAPSQTQFDKVVSRKGVTNKVPDLKPTPTPKVTTKTPKVTTKTPKVTTKTPKVTTKTPKVTTKTPKVTTKTPKVTTKTPKVTTKKTTTSRKYQPPVNRRASPFKPPTPKVKTPKVKTTKKNPFGGKYGGTWPKQGKWTPAAARAKLKRAGLSPTAKNIAKIGGGALAGYGLSKLLDATPGQKPTTGTGTGTKTRADLNTPYRKKPVDRNKPGRTIGTQAGGKKPAVKGQVDPLAVGPKPKTQTRKETSSAKMAGRPEDRKSRDVTADMRHFAISRGGTQDDPNRGFRRRLFGKNVSEAKAKKDMEAAYKREQDDRYETPNKLVEKDKYKYGTGRRSQLKGKQGVRKGGAIKKSYNTGGTVRFSSGGSVIDTYNYDN